MLLKLSFPTLWQCFTLYDKASYRSPKHPLLFTWSGKNTPTPLPSGSVWFHMFYFLNLCMYVCIYLGFLILILLFIRVCAWECHRACVEAKGQPEGGGSPHPGFAGAGRQAWQLQLHPLSHPFYF